MLDLKTAHTLRRAIEARQLANRLFTIAWWGPTGFTYRRWGGM